MATSHLCSNGKWRPGTVAECPKHTRLSKKQSSVYRSRDDGDKPSGSGDGGTTSSGGSESGSG